MKLRFNGCEVVIGIFEQALSHQLGWLEQEGKLSMYRYFLARRESLLNQEEKRRSLSEFLGDFGFKSLREARQVGKSLAAVTCAALAGNVDVLRQLLEAKCSMSVGMAGLPKLGFVAGLTPLHIAVLQCWRQPWVLQILLEADGDPNTAAKGVPILACCRTARDVETLVDYEADVNGRAWPLQVPVLALASGESVRPEVIAKLLELRADPNPPQRGGLGIKQPLSFLAINAKSHAFALETAKVLLEARSDVNLRCSAGALFYSVEMCSRLLVRVAPSGRVSTLTKYMAEWSMTPLGAASLFAQEEFVELLLAYKGDPTIRNARGKLPLDLAKSVRTRKLLQGHRLEELDLDWQSTDWHVPLEQHAAPQDSRTIMGSQTPSSFLRSSRASASSTPPSRFEQLAVPQDRNMLGSQTPSSILRSSRASGSSTPPSGLLSPS